MYISSSLESNLSVKSKLIKFIFLVLFINFSYPLVTFCQTKVIVENTVIKPDISFKNNSNQRIKYVDTIYLGLFKTALVEIKGIKLNGGNIGCQPEEISIGQQDSTSILLLKARKKNFAETVLNVFGQDTTMQFLVKYQDNPDRTLFSYTVPGYVSSLYANTTNMAKYRQIILDSLEASEKKALEDSLKGKSALELNAKNLMNPKNKLFTAMRSKNQNISVGSVDRGVRIYLQKIYSSGKLTYFMFKIANFSMSPFQLSNFTISKAVGNSNTPVKVINEESAYNLLKRFEKVDFIVISESLELDNNQKLLFDFSTNKEKLIKFEMTSKEFQKRESL